MSEPTTGLPSYTVAFAIVSAAQVLVTEVLRTWEPVTWIGNRVFDVWSRRYGLGGIRETFWGTAAQQGDAEQEEFRRRRAAVVHIAGAGAEVGSLLVGLLASLLALLGSAYILASSTVFRFWFAVALVLVLVEVVDAIQLFRFAAAGELAVQPPTSARSAIGNYWRDLRNDRALAPFAATVVLVNIYVVLLSVLLG